MNQALVGALTTIVSLGAIGIMAQEDKGKQPAQVQPAATLTPDQRQALQQAFNLPPGSEVEVEITNRDGGSLRTVEHGRGVGAGAVAEGDKLDQRFDGTPPRVGRGADGSQTAEGGGADTQQYGSALRVPPLPWENPLFWTGLACLGIMGFGIYANLRRLAVICGVAGIGLIATAFYPVILLFAVAAVVIVLVAPYVYAEVKKRKAEQDDEASWEALRAVVAGVEGKGVPAEARQAVKNAIAAQADARDKAVIDEVKRMDAIGKYAD